MFEILLKRAKAKLLPIPVAYELKEVMNAWVKVDKILETSHTDVHVDVAQNLFNRMLSYYGFTAEQRLSPLIAGMQDKIDEVRSNVIITRR